MFWSQLPNNISVNGHLYTVNFWFWHMYEQSTMWDKVSETVTHALWENLLCLCGIYEQNPHFALHSYHEEHGTRTQKLLTLMTAFTYGYNIRIDGNSDGFKFLYLLGCILLPHIYNGPKQCRYCLAFLFTGHSRLQWKHWLKWNSNLK